MAGRHSKKGKSFGRLAYEWLPVFYRRAKKVGRPKARSKKLYKELVLRYGPPARRRQRTQRVRKLALHLNAKKDIIITLSKARPKKPVKARKLVIPLFKKQLELRRTKPPARVRRKKVKSRELALELSGQAFLTFLLIVGGLVGSWHFGTQVTAHYMPPADRVELAPPAPQKVVKAKVGGLKRSKPLSISIPSIRLGSELVTLSRNEDGTIEVPNEYMVPGWYKNAPTPGQVGPAIIVGHVDSYEGPAVFYNLKKLKSGDRIIIRRADKKVLEFKVTTVKQFSQTKFPTKEVYGNINHSGLRLITCGGVFNSQTLRYSHNTVVYAKLAK